MIDIAQQHQAFIIAGHPHEGSAKLIPTNSRNQRSDDRDQQNNHIEQLRKLSINDRCK